jgi:hypothetical protein
MVQLLVVTLNWSERIDSPGLTQEHVQVTVHSIRNGSMRSKFWLPRSGCASWSVPTDAPTLTAAIRSHRPPVFVPRIYTEHGPSQESPAELLVLRKAVGLL